MGSLAVGSSWPSQSCSLGKSVLPSPPLCLSPETLGLHLVPLHPPQHRRMWGRSGKGTPGVCWIRAGTSAVCSLFRFVQIRPSHKVPGPEGTWGECPSPCWELIRLKSWRVRPPPWLKGHHRDQEGAGQGSAGARGAVSLSRAM